MSHFKHHITFQILAVIVSAVLLAPLLVKVSHLFQDHKHEVCVSPNETHFHNYEIDCDYYNFTLNTNFFEVACSFEFFEFQAIKTQIVSQYQFISEYQHLHFSLRGPPDTV